MTQKFPISILQKQNVYISKNKKYQILSQTWNTGFVHLS